MCLFMWWQEELFDGEHLLNLTQHVTDDIIDNFLSGGGTYTEGGDYTGEDNNSDSGISS